MEYLEIIGYLVSYLVGILVGGIGTWNNRKKYIAHLVATAKMVGVEIEEDKNGFGVTVKK